MNPKISIIIPAYNREDTIHFALDSLLRQTFQDFEVIIIDDGSTDNTAKIVEMYKRSNFKYIYQENSGVSVARNKGIDLASGEVICFLDSDDFYEDTFLEKMYSKIKTKNFDICYCGYFIVTSKEKKKCKTLFKEGDILIDYILDRVKVCTNSWMIRKKLIDKYNICFPENVSWGEDMEFFSEVLSKTDRICFVNEYLTNYVFHEDDNRLSTFSLDKLDKDFDFINRLIIKLKANKNPLLKKALVDYRLSALITYRLYNSLKIGLNKKILLNTLINI